MDETNQRAIRLSGPMDARVFAFFACVNESGVASPNVPRLAHRPWPKYAPLLGPIRHAIFLAPFVRDIEAASQEQIDDETKERFVEALQRNVSELEQENV